MKQRGFTLIELLVVVAIIGILATVVLASLSQARLRAQRARVQAELRQFETIVVGAQVETSQTLREITGNGCSNCSCRSSVVSGPLSELSDASGCVATWQAAADDILTAFDDSSDASVWYEDPWGSPYLLDENEGEILSNPCRFDTLTSAGPDRIFPTSDDITTALPYESCS